MAKTKKEYERTKDRILNSKLSEIEKSNRLFQNWQDYIFGSIPEHKKQAITTNHFNEMFFITM